MSVTTENDVIQDANEVARHTDFVEDAKDLARDTVTPVTTTFRRTIKKIRFNNAKGNMHIEEPNYS